MAVDVIARALAARADSKSETAYGYAVEGGYTGTEQQFGEDLGQIGNNAQVMSNAVRFDEAQSKSDAEKEQAQSNIGLDVALGDIDAQIANKANPDGLYESLTTGYTYNFTSDTFIVDKEPYNYRTAGGSADVGDREDVETLVGGTLNINQLTYNGNFASTDAWVVNRCSVSVANNIGTATCTDASSTSFNIRMNCKGVVGHKVLVKARARVHSTNAVNRIVLTASTSGLTDFVPTNVVSYPAQDTWYDIFAIAKVAATTLYYYISATYTSTIMPTVGDTMDVMNMQMIDLTAMFGSATIADYLYGITAANAKAWLFKYFPILNGGYIPYSTPSLQSTCADEHIMDGFNQWDEVAELGIINNQTGQNSSSTTRIRSKNYIEVFPNTSYTISTGDIVSASTVYFYGVDKGNSYLGYRIYNDGSLAPFTTPANCYYIRFIAPSSYGSTYKNDICVNLHWDGERDGEYAPYESHTYAMGHDELRGIYTLDADNNLFLDPTKNDTKSSDGTITRRWALANLGEMEWTQVDGSYPLLVRYSSSSLVEVAKGITATVVASVLCTKYEGQKWSDLGNSAPNGIYIKSNGSIFLRDTNYNTADALTTALSGVYLLYELATPTTESGTAYTETQWADNWGTEQFTDYAVKQGTRSVPLPVGHVTKYPPDLKAKLEMFPESPDGDGDYIVRQSNGLNSYVPLPNELPPDPTEDGQYKLKAIVSDGVVTPTWVAMQ